MREPFCLVQSRKSGGKKKKPRIFFFAAFSALDEGFAYSVRSLRGALPPADGRV